MRATLAHTFPLDTMCYMASRTEPITKRIANNGNVSYTFQVDVGVLPGGGRARKRFTYPTKAKALQERRLIMTQVEAGTYVAKTPTTVGEYLETWIKNRRDVRTATRENYRQSLKPVVEQLGGLKLQDLTRQHVEDLVEQRLNAGTVTRPDLSEKARAVLAFVAAHGADGCSYRQVEAEFGTHGPKQLDRLRAGGLVERPTRGRYVAVASERAGRAGRGVSASTVNTMLTLLVAALRQAVADGLIVRNVAEYVERPKHVAPKTPAWVDADALRFRDHVAGRREAALWLLTLAGLRRSEVLGLSWASVDVEAGTVTVEAGRVPVKGGTEIGQPKSWRSARTLPLAPDVAEALRSFKTVQARERLVIGGEWPDTGLVAVNADGSPIRPETYSAEFRRLAREAGVSPIPLKGVRNTAASQLMAAGLSPVDAAAWLGHDPAMTLRIYAHARQEGLAAAASALSRSS